MRKEKCALDRGAIEALILNNTYGTLALSQEGKPYSIPMNYGYRDGCFISMARKKECVMNMYKRTPMLVLHR